VRAWVALGFALLVVAAPSAFCQCSGTATSMTCTNSTALTVADATGAFPSETPGVASSCPSSITVSGMTGTISSLQVKLNRLSSQQTADLDMLLVSPSGTKFVFLSDAGGDTGITSNATVTFDDSAGTLASTAGGLPTSSYKPSAYGGADSFSSPAPAPTFNGDYAATDGAATFTSKSGGADPNGTWSLYVMDDSAGGTAGISGGWCVAFTLSSDTPSTTSVSSSANPPFTGDSVTFTATLQNSSTHAAVTVGTVTFREGTTVLAGPLSLNGTGQASFSTSTLTEAVHTITAYYSGSPGAYNTSNGSVDQEVNNHTVVTGTQYCNPGTISHSSSGTATPYPSHIFIPSLPAAITKLTPSLENFSHTQTADLDLLLVGPTGAQIVPFSDVGGNTGITSGADITLDDAAASALPGSGGITSGTYKPTSPGGADPFPAPAPTVNASDYAATDGAATFGSVFNGTNPGGTWSLYAVNDNAGGTMSITGGWCLDIATDYLLTTGVSPAGTGTVTPPSGNYYAPSTVVPIAAAPNAGYVFNSWTGPVASPTSASTTVTMNEPTTVTANFTPAATSLSGLVVGKSGPQNARVWTLRLSNSGPGVANGAQIDSFGLTQVAGAACTPVVSSPAAFPLPITDMAPSSSGPMGTRNISRRPNSACSTEYVC
jgi:uncharacterized repeat protein (TIGR02543 family)